eukprot:5412-Chlamydomonas_euryale.AAC.1
MDQTGSARSYPTSTTVRCRRERKGQGPEKVTGSGPSLRMAVGGEANNTENNPQGQRWRDGEQALAKNSHSKLLCRTH